VQHVTIYTKDYCPYCRRAKELLTQKGVDFEEIDVTTDTEGQKAMAVRAHGRSTVPQIFIGEQHIGGCDDIHALEAAGKLDALLA
jgi:glutaredoxin 3